MTDRRDPGRKLLADAQRFKRERDAAREIVARQRVVLDELRLTAVSAHLSGRLVRIDYFDQYIGVENVLDHDGRIDWRELDKRVDALLDRQPELAA